MQTCMSWVRDSDLAMNSTPSPWLLCQGIGKAPSLTSEWMVFSYRLQWLWTNIEAFRSQAPSNRLRSVHDLLVKCTPLTWYKRALLGHRRLLPDNPINVHRLVQAILTQTLQLSDFSRKRSFTRFKGTSIANSGALHCRPPLLQWKGSMWAMWLPR